MGEQTEDVADSQEPEIEIVSDQGGQGLTSVGAAYVATMTSEEISRAAEPARRLAERTWSTSSVATADRAALAGSITAVTDRFRKAMWPTQKFAALEILGGQAKPHSGSADTIAKAMGTTHRMAALDMFGTQTGGIRDAIMTAAGPSILATNVLGDQTASLRAAVMKATTPSIAMTNILGEQTKAFSTLSDAIMRATGPSILATSALGDQTASLRAAVMKATAPSIAMTNVLGQHTKAFGNIVESISKAMDSTPKIAALDIFSQKTDAFREAVMKAAGPDFWNFGVLSDQAKLFGDFNRFSGAIDALGAVRSFADTFDGFVAEAQHQTLSSSGRAVHTPEWYLVTLFGGTYAGLQYLSLRLAHPELAGFVDDVFAAAALAEFVRRKIAKHLRE